MNKLYKSQIVINNKLQEKFVMKEMFKLKTYRQLMTFKFKIFFVQKSGKKRKIRDLKKKSIFHCSNTKLFFDISTYTTRFDIFWIFNST